MKISKEHIIPDLGVVRLLVLAAKVTKSWGSESLTIIETSFANSIYFENGHRHAVIQWCWNGARVLYAGHFVHSKGMTHSKWELRVDTMQYLGCVFRSKCRSPSLALPLLEPEFQKWCELVFGPNLSQICLRQKDISGEIPQSERIWAVRVNSTRY